MAKSASKSIAKIKKKADRTFSRYIRLKNSVAGYCSCVTCGTRKPIKNIQAGHYIPRNILSTRFDEENVHPQCVGCNMFNKGRLDEYAVYLEKNYEIGILQRLHNKKHELVKITYSEYEEMIDKWEDEINDLEAGIELGEEL